MYGGFASPKMDMNRRNVSSAIQERNRTCSLKSLTPFACTDTEKLPALWQACLFPHAQTSKNYLHFGESANFRWYKCRRSTCIAAVLLLVACIDAGCHAATRCRGRIPRSKATSLWHPKTKETSLRLLWLRGRSRASAAMLPPRHRGSPAQTAALRRLPR